MKRLKLENPMEDLQTTFESFNYWLLVDSGNNIINGFTIWEFSGAETIAINTDRRHLEMIVADKNIY